MKQNAGYLEGDGLTADPMFRREDLERWLERKNLPVRWVDGVYDRLANGESIQNAQPLKSLRIWQLKPDTPIEMRFIGLDRMAREFDGPNPSQYRIAYDGQAESQELEDIWNKFCRRTLPGGDHPLAISDVIELYDVDGSAFYYVDKREIVSVDFTPVIHENMNTPEPSRKDGSDQRLFQKLEQEYLAYLEPLRSAALSELLEKAGEIADTQAVYPAKRTPAEVNTLVSAPARRSLRSCGNSSRTWVAYLTNISCWISGGRTDGRFPRAQISSAPPIMVRVRVFIWMCT